MIILASTSSTRQALLKNAGIVFSAISPTIDERQLAAEHPEWSIDDIPLRLAEAKALDVSKIHPEAIVVGADQILLAAGKIYSKPRDLIDCRSQLSALRGQTHKLISSVACAAASTVLWSLTDTATLSMRQFSDAFLEYYLDCNAENCTKSVGGYQVEGPGLQLFDKVEGDHFTILGLPLLPLLQFLRTVHELKE